MGLVMYIIAFRNQFHQRIYRDVKAANEQQAYVIAHSMAKKNKWKVINYKRAS
jgi:hypothetical protein